MQRFLDALVARLPVSLQPYAKALGPLVVGAALVIQDLTVSVEEVNELKVLAVAAATSLLVLALRNVGR